MSNSSKDSFLENNTGKTTFENAEDFLSTDRDKSFLVQIRMLEKKSQSLVWWSLKQIDRGEHLINNPKKGERPWHVPETTGKFLYQHIIHHTTHRVLELGTSIGYSTLWMAQALAKKDTKNNSLQNYHIDTIENSPNKIPVAIKNFQNFELDQYIQLHVVPIMQFLQELSKDTVYDMVFMDADRGHYHEYLPYIQNHLSPAGVMIVDNALNMQSRMQPFLDALLNTGFEYVIKEIDNGLLIAKKVF